MLPVSPSQPSTRDLMQLPLLPYSVTSLFPFFPAMQCSLV